MDVEQHAPNPFNSLTIHFGTKLVGNSLLCFRNRSVIKEPRGFGRRVSLRGFPNFAIGIQLTAVQIVENNVGYFAVIPNKALGNFQG